MHIKDMPEHERPMERLLYNGASMLSTAELLAIIIRTGSGDKSAVQVAEDVISYATSEAGSLAQVTAKELMMVPGIGVCKACSIVASIELANRIASSDMVDRKADMKSVELVADALIKELRHEKQEHLVEYILDSKCQLESRKTISIGTLSSTTMHPREVLGPALKWGAAGIILAHNHPSGDPSPSGDDITCTNMIREAANLVGIKLLDHIIVGADSYYSFKENGLI